MRNRLAVLVLLTFVFAATFAAADTITFNGVADGTVVNTLYSGVTFSCVACSSTQGSGPDVYARGDGTNNTVSLIPAGTLALFDARQGGIQATFDVAQSFVSIDAQAVLPPEYLTDPTNAPFLEAFDASGNLLGETLYPIAYGGSGYGTFQTLSFTSGSNNIAYVIFSSQHNSGTSVYGAFDNLTFTTTNGGGNDGGGTNVPEPGSLLLLAGGASAMLLKKNAWRFIS